MTAGAMLSSLLWFVAILAAIPLALWLLKRSNAVGPSAPSPMRTVATLSLSPSQKLAIVEVGRGEARRWLLLGVSSQGVNTLHEMAPQEEVPTAAQAAVPFAQLLSRLTPRKD